LALIYPPLVAFFGPSTSLATPVPTAASPVCSQLCRRSYSGWTRSSRRCAPRVYNINWGPYNREIQKKYSVFSIKFNFQISGEKPKAERFPIYHSVFPVYRSFFLVFIFSKKFKFLKN
jgi:hypothetical protein